MSQTCNVSGDLISLWLYGAVIYISMCPNSTKLGDCRRRHTGSILIIGVRDERVDQLEIRVTETVKWSIEEQGVR